MLENGDRRCVEADLPEREGRDGNPQEAFASIRTMDRKT